MLIWRDTGSHYVALAVLGLSMSTRMGVISQKSSCLSLLSAGIRDVHYEAWLCLNYFVATAATITTTNTNQTPTHPTTITTRP